MLCSGAHHLQGSGLSCQGLLGSWDHQPRWWSEAKVLPQGTLGHPWGLLALSEWGQGGSSTPPRGWPPCPWCQDPAGSDPVLQLELAVVGKGGCVEITSSRSWVKGNLITLGAISFFNSSSSILQENWQISQPEPTRGRKGTWAGDARS